MREEKGFLNCKRNSKVSSVAGTEVARGNLARARSELRQAWPAGLHLPRPHQHFAFSFETGGSQWMVPS